MISAIHELEKVWRDCGKAGWDGYGAYPVEQEAYRAARAIIESLPAGFPQPSIGAEPAGRVTLEWHKSSSRTLSVSVDPAGFLYYAGVFGPNKRYGTLTFYSAAPDELIQLVRGL